MIRHIVMWKLNDKADAEAVKQRLEALRGKIPSLIHIEVGVDFSNTDASADVVLVSDFEHEEGLAAYQAHPEHQAVLPFMKSVVASRSVVDFISA